MTRFLFVSINYGHINLLTFLFFSVLVFSMFGFLFGNLNAMALEPMGHIAGTASSIIATFSNMIALSIGAIMSYFFTDTVTPLLIVFLLCSATVIFIMFYLGKLDFNIS